MKKCTATLTTALIASQAYIFHAYAALPGPATVPGVPDGSPKDVIIKVITEALNFVTLLAVIFVIVAGIRLFVSGGDEGEKDKAKKTIIYAVVGLVVVILARVLIQFVISLFA